jgi:hypothetical protein
LKEGALDSLYILHSVNLVFHEAGHTIFGLFGQFIGFLGGTLMQLLIPLLLILYFIRDGQWFASYVMLWWFGENFIDLAPYIGDARAQQIGLIGGEHDFAYLLGRMGWLELDEAFERLFLTLGFSIMIIAVLLMGRSVSRSFKSRAYNK